MRNPIYKLFMLLILILFLLPISFSQSDHMTLLAVSESEDGYKGSVADLYLEINPGSGKVFIESYPASKIDTQITTRFAKEMACKYLKKECEEYDFFYTIRAGSPIIGGPSAGAAMSLLTISLLSPDEFKVSEHIALTGTINSGYLIGPVGGVKQKIEAAAENGLKKVLIPNGERLQPINSSLNITPENTLDMVDYGKNLSIEVVEISNLDEALTEFTGKQIEKKNKTIEVDSRYRDIMLYLAQDLCKRTESLKNILSNQTFENTTAINDTFFIQRERAENLTIKGKSNLESRRYYSSASFCYGANTQYGYLILKSKDPDNETILKEITAVEKEISAFEELAESRELKTITDLQSYMIVKERISEAKTHLKNSREFINGNNSVAVLSQIALATERLYSAESWSNFFDMPGRKINLNEEILSKGCMDKVREAEERYQYSQFIFPGLLQGTREQIDKAVSQMSQKNYAVCLYQASIAKAQANVVLSTLGVREENFNDVILLKIEAAKETIVEQQEKDMFPISGYSYYEYANSLKDEDPYSTLLYAEYALELSNLDIYFKNKSETNFFYGIMLIVKQNLPVFVVFIGGICIGMIMSFGFKNNSKSRQHKPLKSKNFKNASGIRLKRKN
ncbi:S16 family serine protease [Nanoarchaeota archaeon]